MSESQRCVPPVNVTRWPNSGLPKLFQGRVSESCPVSKTVSHASRRLPTFRSLLPFPPPLLRIRPSKPFPRDYAIRNVVPHSKYLSHSDNLRRVSNAKIANNYYTRKYTSVSLVYSWVRRCWARKEEKEGRGERRLVELFVAVNVVLYSSTRRDAWQNPFREKRIAAINTLRRLFYENRGREGARFKGKRRWIYDRGIRHAKLNETFFNGESSFEIKEEQRIENQSEDKGKTGGGREGGREGKHPESGERGEERRTDGWTRVENLIKRK